ncbi:OLC1v1026203C1 [Oldenlandia corymbosa var. corymbosa]|uniref:OLC1v1026203C1 n=1 Tax=Oldenlandia corymbosa var. corymbosa TaxID=529605 RepID=A0AAV1C9V6_OLDCO|nr:OLC1v1026203C1 [Oldenlandia corymbosa var. corymbosa]
MNWLSSLGIFYVISLVLCSILLAYSLGKLRNKSSERLLPPGPTSWPIVGNLLQLTQLPHRDLASLCQKYGPLVYLRLGSVDAITTDDPEIIKEILVHQDDVFASRPRTLAAVHLAYGCGDVALAPLGPKWKRMRRICMEHLLTTRRLESFARHRAEEAQHLVQDVWTKAQTEGKVNLREVLAGENGQRQMDDTEIKALIQDMIAAATDTSAVTNEWAMAEVIKHPHVLTKIQKELDDVVGRDRMVLESDLVHLKYLRCVVRETFRMHPAGPFLIPHESVRATKIYGYYIPAKTRVFINTHGLGRNTKIWDQVEEFRPERHLPADGSRVEISHGADFKILPFSAGKRKCPGAPLGVTLVLMALARLFHCFDWSPADKLRPEDIDTTEVYGMTMPKARPLEAIARPRLSSHLYR